MKGDKARVGLMKVRKEGRYLQWVFYKVDGRLMGNSIEITRYPVFENALGFSGSIQVNELKGARWTLYFYEKGRLKKAYFGDLGEQSVVLRVKEKEGIKVADGAGGTSLYTFIPGIGIRKESNCYEGQDSHGGSGGGGSSFSGDDGDSYYGGEIDTVVVTAHRKKRKVKAEPGYPTPIFPSVVYPPPEEPDPWGWGYEEGSGIPIGPVTITAHRRKERASGRAGIPYSSPPPARVASKELVDEKGEPLKEEEIPCKTTVEDLQKVFPKTKSKTLEEIADLVNKHGKDFGLDSKEKLQHFLAQAGEETYQLKTFHKYTNYRLSLLGTSKTYWSDKFNTIKNPKADPNKKNPNDYANPSKPGYADGEKLLNLVYQRKDLGNTQPGDGWKYRGRGILQLTGRANYRSFNTFYKGYQEKHDSLREVDVLANPEWLNDDKAIGVISGLWYFKSRVLNKINIGDKTSVEEVTKKVNGLTNGLIERKRLYKEAKTNIKCH